MEVDVNSTAVENIISDSSTGVQINAANTSTTINEETVSVTLSNPILETRVLQTVIDVNINANTAESIIIGIAGADGTSISSTDELAEGLTNLYYTESRASTVAASLITAFALTLGTAAYAATTDFATAAQGALATSALQSGDNISVLNNDAGYITSSALSGYVPYTGATGSVDLGVFNLSATRVLTGVGTAAAPSYSFTGFLNQGMYSVSTNVLGFSQGGAVRFQVFTAGVESSAQVRGLAVNAATPTFVSSGDTNTGVFFLNSDVMGIATGGLEAFRVDASGNTGFGTGATVSARIHGISLTEQLRLGATAAIYWSATTADTTGVTTFNATGGTTPSFAFTDSTSFSTAASTSNATFTKQHNATSFLANLVVNTQSPLSGANLNQYGINSTYTVANSSGVISNSNMYAMSNAIVKTGAFNASTLVANRSSISIATIGGSITNAILFQGAFSSENSANTITSAYGLKMENYAGSASSAVTSIYGAYIGTLKGTGVTNAYGIYQEGASDLNYFNAAVSIGVLAGSAKLHVISTTEQQRIGYDVSNYYSTTVSSAGVVTFNAVGASAGFLFSDAVSVSDINGFINTTSVVNVGNANTVAAGANRITMGISNSASSNGATAIGRSNTASGITAVALGFSNSGAGINIGGGCSGSGVSIGTGVGTSTNANSVVIGSNSTCAGDYEIVIGAFSSAAGIASMAVGYACTATQSNDLSMGLVTNATGGLSLALGSYVTASAANSGIIGMSPISFGITNATADSLMLAYESNSILMTATNSTFNQNITIADAKNIVLNTTTGTKIGTATGQKIGLWNVTPIIQPASANQAAVAATVATTASTNIAPYGYSTAAQADDLITEVGQLKVLVNQIRSDLVAFGAIKGAA